VTSEDWKSTQSADETVAKVLARLERRGRGIIVFHDIRPNTGLALPPLLRELKARGYKVVHMVE
jgi:peptidoglycan-N-acetylglucosamine deacetylase